MATAKYKLGIDGYFQAKVWDGTMVNGRKHYITLRSKKSSKDLENIVNEHNRNITERKFIRNTDVTFRDYSKQWLSTHKAHRSKNTQSMYRIIIDNHFIKVSCSINDINRSHYYYMINNAPGDRTRQQIALTFKQVIKSAIRDKLLAAGVYDDIFGDSQPIKYKAPEKRVLHDKEKDAIFKANFTPMDRAFIYILYGCGLRRGEALALDKTDILLETKEVVISKAVAFDKNSGYIKEPKTQNGYRTVPIPEKVFPFIQEYVENLEGSRLFYTKNGAIVSRTSYRKMWNRIIGEINACMDVPVTDLTAHIFRHNYCTALCYEVPKISLKKVAELLGDTEKMVIDVYSHIVEKRERAHEVVSSAF